MIFFWFGMEGRKDIHDQFLELLHFWDHGGKLLGPGVHLQDPGVYFWVSGVHFQDIVVHL